MKSVTQSQTKGRNYQMDNIKCLLIFSVVLGHILELIMNGNPGDKLLYLIIYSWHMPLFAFTSGAFARFSPEKIRNNMIYPYLIFQTLYLVFANVILGKELKVQYTTPYWLLWYLFAMIIWNLLLPLVQTDGFKKKLLLLAAAFAAAVLIGFDTKAGYYLSFSRIVQFFPFFLLGVYSRDIREKAGDKLKFLHKHRYRIAAVIILIVCLVLSMLYLAGNLTDIRLIWMYGAYSYEKADYSYRFKLLYQVIALVWLAFLVLVIPCRRLPVISHIGANTMTVYLMHGFVIRWLSSTKLFGIIEHQELAALLLTCLLVLFFSWKPVVAALSPAMRWHSGNKNHRAGKRPDSPGTISA